MVVFMKRSNKIESKLMVSATLDYNKSTPDSMSTRGKDNAPVLFFQMPLFLQMTTYMTTEHYWGLSVTMITHLTSL